MESTTRARRARLRFSDEFKAQTVQLVSDEGTSVTAVRGSAVRNRCMPRRTVGSACWCAPRLLKAIIGRQSRIHEDLLEQDMRVSRKRVIRLMQEEGLQARMRKRFERTTTR